MSIYHEIWEADMKTSGLRPILANENNNHADGYVVVDPKLSGPEHSIFKDIYIPDWKRRSYQLVETLFDNYTFNQLSREKNTLYESKEVEEFLNMAIDSFPLQVAKKFIETKWNQEFNRKQWFTYLHQLWFRKFNWESGKDLSGFEHVFIGEQKYRKLAGHHFWYKYYLEDNPTLNKQNVDQIDITCLNYNEQNLSAPYIITAGYHLKAYDYEKRRYVKVLKKKCAFFVGISAEGLLALGTVRAMSHKDVPDHIVMNDVPYKLELYMSPDGKSIRTFYPSFDLSLTK